MTLQTDAGVGLSSVAGLTAGKLPKAASTNSISDSLVSESGSTVTVAGTLSATTIKIGSTQIGGAQRTACVWKAAEDPNERVIATVDQASTLVSLVGTVVAPVGAAATISVYKAGSGTAAAAGTVLHSGSFDANGTANTNQTLTITVTALSAGDRIALVTTGGVNWTGGSGSGGITARFTTP